MAEATCPSCGTTGLDISLTDSEQINNGGCLRRKFECNNCYDTFFTYEVSLSPKVAGLIDTMAGAKKLTWSEVIEQTIMAASSREV